MKEIQQSLIESCDLERYLRTVQIKQCPPKSFLKFLRHCIDILNAIPSIKEIKEWENGLLLKMIFENINVERTIQLIEKFLCKLNSNLTHYNNAFADVSDFPSLQQSQKKINLCQIVSVSRVLYFCEPNWLQQH